MLRRIGRYAILFLIISVLLSFISIYKNWDILSASFSSALQSFFGIGLYLFIYAAGFGLIWKSIFR